MSGTRPADKLAQLELEVQAARGELAATVGELAGWFDPKTRMTAAVDRGRQMVNDVVNDATDPAADPAERTRARIVLAVAAGGVAAALAGVVGRLARR